MGGNGNTGKGGPKTPNIPKPPAKVPPPPAAEVSETFAKGVTITSDKEMDKFSVKGTRGNAPKADSRAQAMRVRAAYGGNTDLANRTGALLGVMLKK